MTKLDLIYLFKERFWCIKSMGTLSIINWNTCVIKSEWNIIISLFQKIKLEFEESKDLWTRFGKVCTLLRTLYVIFLIYLVTLNIWQNSGWLYPKLNLIEWLIYKVTPNDLLGGWKTYSLLASWRIFDAFSKGKKNSLLISWNILPNQTNTTSYKCSSRTWLFG